jgi:hypothetical protein
MENGREEEPCDLGLRSCLNQQLKFFFLGEGMLEACEVGFGK